MKKILPDEALRLYNKLKNYLVVIPEDPNYRDNVWVRFISDGRKRYSLSVQDCVDIYPLQEGAFANLFVAWNPKIAERDKRFVQPTFEQFCQVYDLELIMEQ